MIKRELLPNELSGVCNPETLGFETTDEVSITDGIIEQKRALRAIDFGLNLKGEGFNIYVAGASGTGKNATILKAIMEIAQRERVPDDICYLYNFEREYEPKVLNLPVGNGYKFKRDIDELIKNLESEINKAFISEDYNKHKKEVIDKFEEKKSILFSDLEKFAGSMGFMLKQSPTGIVVVPVHNGHAVGEKEYEGLSDDAKTRIKKNEGLVYDKLYEVSSEIKDIEKDTKRQIQELDRNVALHTIGYLVEEIKKTYKDNETIQKHLNDVQDDIINNIDIFKKEEEQQQVFLPISSQKERVLNKYRVVLLVDNSTTKGAPVVVEQNPTYYNLIGRIEYRAQFGILTTDFSMIKPGSIHRANGGYLIVQAMDIFRDPFAWDALKRVIKYKTIKIEDITERYGITAISGLKPESVPVDLKIIIVGSPTIYSLAYMLDDDFKKFFKVKADFDVSMERSDKVIGLYSNFIAKKCKEEGLLAFKKEAVAKIIDYGSRLTNHKEKLTARFVDISDIMRESNYWTKSEDCKFVEARHVRMALEEKVYRSNMLEEKIRELIKENTIFIDTEKEKIGQINGIAVLELGDYAFGRPTRITVSTAVGKGDVINIEREAKMSGKIHSKGILILNGYLNEKFAQDKPLAFSASICFEQSYDEVEGDSASSTELYALFSSLSDLPLRQDIAVTGSVNQKGEIQPVGGINEKIEGFYEVCKVKGLTGKHAVMIPQSNIKHLVLKDEVIEAVKNGKFHIYPVGTIDEGIEILTGVEAGIRSKDGKFPKGSVHYRVNEKLNRFLKISKTEGKKDNKGQRKGRN